MQWLARIIGLQRRVCPVCGRKVLKSDAIVSFRCFECSWSGVIHRSCLRLPSSEAMPIIGGSVSGVCPRCRNAASQQVPGIAEELINEIVGLVRQRSLEWDEQPREAGLLPEPTPDPRLEEIAQELRNRGEEDLLFKVYKRAELKGSLEPRDKGYLMRVWGMWW